MMYDGLVKQLRYCATTATCRGCLWIGERCMTEMKQQAADAIEELAAFKAQITDGHFYCMRDGVLYAAKYETKKAKSIQLPPIEFAEPPKEE